MGLDLSCFSAHPDISRRFPSAVLPDRRVSPGRYRAVRPQAAVRLFHAGNRTVFAEAWRLGRGKASSRSVPTRALLHTYFMPVAVTGSPCLRTRV